MSSECTCVRVKEWMKARQTRHNVMCEKERRNSHESEIVCLCAKSAKKSWSKVSRKEFWLFNPSLHVQVRFCVKLSSKLLWASNISFSIVFVLSTKLEFFNGIIGNWNFLLRSFFFLLLSPLPLLFCFSLLFIIQSTNSSTAKTV